MAEARVTGIRAVEIGVTNLEEVARFYTEIWNLNEVGRETDARYYRGTDACHHLLVLRRFPQPCLIRVIFGARDRTVVDALHDRVSRNSRAKVAPPTAWQRPGGGYGFGYKDPEGRNFVVAADFEDPASPDVSDPDRPTKISHVNLNTTDHELTCRSLVDNLGFKLVDETPALMFLHCDDTDHHSVVLHKGGGPTLNHVAFEMPDVDANMRGIGRMRDNGYPIEWGVGRHGPGNNVFAYFAGPEECPLEYTSDMLQIDESYRFRGPDHWRWPAGRTDHWGITNPPTPRLQRIQKLFRFSDDGHIV